MASIKIAVTELSAKKAAYTKAARNLREIMQTLTKARNSIGNDKMVQHAKEALKKLVDLLDRRAFELEALAQVIGTSADGYKTTQKTLVRTVSDFKAHKTDFYGQPVHVSGASGGGAAAAAAGASAAAASSSAGSSAPSAAASGGTSAGTAQASFTSSTGTASAGSSAPENVTINNTYNETNVFVNTSSNGSMGMPSGTGAGAAAAAAMNTSGPSIPAGAAASGGSSIGAGVLGAGIGVAAAASAIGAVGVIAGKNKSKKEAASVSMEGVDEQLAKARQKLNLIENEQEMIQSSLSE